MPETPLRTTEARKKKKNEMERKFNFNPVDSAVGVLKERKKEEKKKV